MTYQFEWLLEKDASLETQNAFKQKWQKMAEGAVDSSIVAIRDMVNDNRIES